MKLQQCHHHIHNNRSLQCVLIARRIVISTILFMVWNSSFVFSQQYFLISGSVEDAASKQPLPSATIRVAGTSKGTITNGQGQFKLSYPSGAHTLIISYVGYETDSVKLLLNGNIDRTIRLQPSPVQIAGITITDEDPAYEIIRRAIESKKKWMAQLRTFEAHSYNRTILRTDTSIAAIIEAYSLLYWNRNDSLREVVKQKRQTGNLPGGFGASRVGEVMNFNDDKIKQGGYTFLGPTAPDAFDYYDYKLLKTVSTDDYDVYQIQLIPKSTIVPLFKGTISIASQTYAVMEVDLSPNEAYKLMFMTIRNSSYKQLFRLVEGKFWLPMNYRYEAYISVSIMGIKIPSIGIERDIVIYDYTINPEFPDSIKRLNKTTIDSAATVFDSTFWKENEVLPLTAEQEDAYRILDSTQTLEKKFAPSGTTFKILSFAGGPVSYADLWFNRVEGFHAGATASFDSVLSNDLTLRGRLGYGFADKEWKYEAGASFRFGGESKMGTTVSFANILISRKIFTVTADLYDKHIPFPPSTFAGYLFNSFYALIDKDDFYDYYRAKGIQTTLTYQPISSLRMTAGATAEQHTSVYQNTTFAWFARNKLYRPQPHIVEGSMNAMKLSVSYKPFGFIAFAKDALTMDGSLEHASDIFAGSFNFTQYLVKVRGKISTMVREELPMPPSLDVYISFGITNGKIPPQRYFSPGTDLLGFSSAGSIKGVRTREFFGDNFATVTMEHNFRGVLFSFLPVRSLKESTLDLIIGGTVSQYWLSGSVITTPNFPAKDTKGMYYEASVGLQNILDLFRVDVTRRFTTPRDVVVTLSVSDFFSSFMPGQ